MGDRRGSVAGSVRSGRMDAGTGSSEAAGGAWTTRRLLAWMSEAFTKAGLESPRLQSEMLLAHVIGCQRLRLFIEPERSATEEERGRLRGLVARALKHEPMDYLVGERSFFGLLFQVDRRVLVPRPSTETIVEHVLQAARRAQEASGLEGEREAGSGDGGRGPAREPEAERGERVFGLEDREGATLSAFKPSEEDVEEEDERDLEKPVVSRAASAPPARRGAPQSRGTPVAKRGRATGPAWRIADVCTGSGCVAVALAKHLPGASVVGTDISAEALEVARANGARHGVSARVEWRCGDLLRALAGCGTFDVIVSNPPYIPDDEWDAVAANVRDHEPELALRGGEDGLRLVGPLIAGAAGLLAPGGWLAVEVAASRAEEALGLARSSVGLVDQAILRDCDGLPRVIVARRG